jgi:hypothetical protein
MKYNIEKFGLVYEENKRHTTRIVIFILRELETNDFGISTALVVYENEIDFTIQIEMIENTQFPNHVVMDMRWQNLSYFFEQLVHEGRALDILRMFDEHVDKGVIDK